jgi:Zn-dependent protease
MRRPDFVLVAITILLAWRPMDSKILIDGLILYLGLLMLLTFHEFGHAWMAWKCGDDTARLQGRVSLNPIVHIDVIGTVVMPLLMIFLSMSGSGLGRFLVGWAKPVPVNPDNLRNPRVDDILVTLAGPWMNLLLAVVLMGLGRLGLMGNSETMVSICLNMAHLSLMLCFFNLLPIPPLDGAQVVRSLLGISYEAYYQVARYGFIVLIIVLQIPMVREALGAVTNKSFAVIADWFGVPLPR